MLLSLILVAQTDILDEVMRRAAELKSCSATYELTSTASPGATRIRIDFSAPSRVRIDRTMQGQETFMWSVDGVLAMHSRGGKEAFGGRASSADAQAQLAPIEMALHHAFPAAELRAPIQSAVGMHWAFDTKAQQAVFSIDAQLGHQFETPLGWLATLKEKRAQPRLEDGLLKFETDDAFQIAISTPSGFLQRFFGKSPKGEMQIELLSLELDQSVDASRFTIPEQSADVRDISSELLRVVQRNAQQDLRRRMYVAIAGKDAPAVWDEARLAAIHSVLRPFYEKVVVGIVESKLEKWGTIRESVAKSIADMRKAGKSEEEIERKRRREADFLKQQLDEQEAGFQKGIEVPGSVAALPRAEELLTLEKQAILECYRLKVREPMLAQFESATGK